MHTIHGAFIVTDGYSRDTMNSPGQHVTFMTVNEHT